MNAQIALLLTLGRLDSNQYDKSFGIRKPLPAVSMTFNRPEADGMEKLDELGSGLPDSFGEILPLEQVAAMVPPFYQEQR
jgi:hypothetical protein